LTIIDVYQSVVNLYFIFVLSDKAYL
jgi:hypothetical protein